ncbi:MAG: hypothetical protein HYX54_04975 [Chloroflexi bacterium]|nr:hypothetical protein [Chloroflexota bacterium]
MDDRIDPEPPEILPGEQALGSLSMADLSAVPSFLRADLPRGAELPSGAARSEGPRFEGRAAQGRVTHARADAAPGRFVGIVPRPSHAEAADPSLIPMATISPRKLLHVVAVVALAWGVISFGRQVATASAASTRADALRAANAALQGEVTAMQRELALIREGRYVAQQARAYRLGSPDEIPFALQPAATRRSSERLGFAAEQFTRGPGDAYVSSSIRCACLSYAHARIRWLTGSIGGRASRTGRRWSGGSGQRRWEPDHVWQPRLRVGVSGDDELHSRSLPARANVEGVPEP